MLQRSSSTPILTSWTPHHHHCSLHLHLPRTNSVFAFPITSPARSKSATCPLHRMLSGVNEEVDEDLEGGGFHVDHGSIKEYYVKMIEAYPDNPLLLANYANFLKEVVGDLVKAEEYCGRAILGNPSDAKTLALYGDIIWLTQMDANRADIYFDQAVKSDPDNSYVLASYAKFLWDAEEEEEEGQNRKSDYVNSRRHEIDLLVDKSCGF